MTINHIRWSTAMAVGMLITLPGSAAHATTGLGFLRDSPLSRFTDQDFELLRNAAVAVLESSSSRASQTWANEATGNSGKVTALKSFASTDGGACKRPRLDNKSPDLEGSWNVSVRSGHIALGG